MIAEAVYCTKGLAKEESRGWHPGWVPLTKTLCTGAHPPRDTPALPLACQACPHSTPFSQRRCLPQTHTGLWSSFASGNMLLLMVAQGGGGEGRWGIVREFGMDMHTLLYFKQITNKDLLYSIAQGTLLNVKWQPGWKGNLGENG